VTAVAPNRTSNGGTSASRTRAAPTIAATSLSSVGEADAPHRGSARGPSAGSGGRVSGVRRGFCKLGTRGVRRCGALPDLLHALFVVTRMGSPLARGRSRLPLTAAG
jgi:hypothetical protein